MKPDLMTFNVGETIHKAPLRLVWAREHARGTFTLHKDAANQRDDSTFIAGIPADVILKMAEAVKGMGHV